VELQPKFDGPMLLIDSETQTSIETTPEYARDEYKAKIDAHTEALAAKARGAGLTYHLSPTDRPLDECLREFLVIRQGWL
jgi:hypothetical protein